MYNHYNLTVGTQKQFHVLCGSYFIVSVVYRSNTCLLAAFVSRLPSAQGRSHSSYLQQFQEYGHIHAVAQSVRISAKSQMCAK